MKCVLLRILLKIFTIILNINNPPQVRAYKSNAPSLPYVVDSIPHWIKLHVGFVKINIDGSYINGNVACGSLIRDHRGYFVKVFFA
jgi:hypothetical protein